VAFMAISCMNKNVYANAKPNLTNAVIYISSSPSFKDISILMMSDFVLNPSVVSYFLKNPEMPLNHFRYWQFY